MLWAIYGILHSLLRAALTETNRIYKIAPLKLAFGQALFGVLVLLFCLPLMTWPSDPHFYKAAAGVALVFSIGILVNHYLSTEKAGRVSSIYMPFEAIGAAIIWTIIAPSVLRGYQADMLMTACVVMAYIIATVGLMMIRPNDLSMRTFLIVAPLGVTYAVAGTVTKAVMPFEMVFQAALSFGLIGFIVMTVVLGLAALLGRQLDRSLFSAHVLSGSLLTGLVSVCAYVAFVTSVALAPNPGYTSLLAFLLPVWLWAWHMAVGIEDKANPAAGLFIVIGSGMLIAAAW